jgi:hypothetical protein
MTLKENYENILTSINDLLDVDILSENSKSSLNILLFKIKDSKDEYLEIIHNNFNITGEKDYEDSETLLNAKKQKIENLFKKNLNYL